MLHVMGGGRASSLYRHPVRESRIWGTVYTGYPLRGYIGYTGYTGYTATTSSLYPLSILSNRILILSKDSVDRFTEHPHFTHCSLLLVALILLAYCCLLSIPLPYSLLLLLVASSKLYATYVGLLALILKDK